MAKRDQDETQHDTFKNRSWACAVQRCQLFTLNLRVFSNSWVLFRVMILLGVFLEFFEGSFTPSRNMVRNFSDKMYQDDEVKDVPDENDGDVVDALDVLRNTIDE